MESAVLGGGCFWCLDAVFRRLRGVEEVESGYAGGTRANPTYEQVCSGITGHAEVVRIEFDPVEIAFTDLLEVFWEIHDPTTKDRQGADVGTQYRSIILYQDDAQKLAARKSLAAAAERLGQPIVTEIAALETFWPAEKYHQDYFGLNPMQPYCLMTIPPKLQKLQDKFGDRTRA